MFQSFHDELVSEIPSLQMGEEEEVDSAIIQKEEIIEEEEEEEEILSPTLPERTLYFEEVGEGLSHVGQASNGDGYAYLKCSIRDMLFTDVSVITKFKHLIYVVLDGNRLDAKGITALRKLPFLYVLIANNNRIETLEWGEPFPNLEYLTLKRNRITSLKGLNQPSLMGLDLKENKIRNFDGLESCNLPNLCRLNVNFNKFTNTKNIPNILEVDLSNNKIKKMEDLERLNKIKFLNLCNNKISSLSGFHENMKDLNILLLKYNKIDDVSEFKKLKCLKNIHRIDVEYNIFDANTEDNYRIVLLAYMPSLRNIDALLVTFKEIEESKRYLKMNPDGYEFHIDDLQAESDYANLSTETSTK